MDEVARFNAERWRRLADANALFTRPWLDMSLAEARQRVEAYGFGLVAGKDVLCLASGGGQQSVAFALCGANVTVVDLSEEQLERDRTVAEHRGVTVEAVQADMRDLSMLHAASFDIVFQPYSIAFVPDVQPVFNEVARVTREDGQYLVVMANPFTIGIQPSDWSGDGYPIRTPYESGVPIQESDPEWVYDRCSGSIAGPVVYRHKLAGTINSLLNLGFRLEEVSDTMSLHPDPNAEPGTWDHFVAFVVPWIAFRLRLKRAG